MSTQATKPYWVDELGRKHEAFGYDDSNSEIVGVEHEGRSIRLIVPRNTPPMTVRVTASSGDLLFLVAKQLEKEDEDGFIIEGGDGIVLVARRHREMTDAYWLLVWHCLYEPTLQFLGK